MLIRQRNTRNQAEKYYEQAGERIQIQRSMRNPINRKYLLGAVGCCCTTGSTCKEGGLWVMGEDYNDDHEKADNGNDHHDDHEKADQQNDENCLVLAWVKRSGLPRRQNHSIDLRLKSTLLSIIIKTHPPEHHCSN